MNKEQIQFIHTALQSDLTEVTKKLNTIKSGIDINQQFCEGENHFIGFELKEKDSHKTYYQCRYCGFTKTI